MAKWLPYALAGGFVLGAVLFAVGYSRWCGCNGQKHTRDQKCGGGCQCSNCTSAQGVHTCSETCSCQSNTTLTFIMLLAAAIIGFLVLAAALKLHFPYNDLNSYMGRNISRPKVPPS